MFYEVEGQCSVAAVLDGDSDLTFNLPLGPWTVRMPTALFEGSHMAAEWSLRFHHTDPEADIFKRLDVEHLNRDANDYLCVRFCGCADDLIMVPTEAEVMVDFAHGFEEAVWLEFVEM